MFSLAMMRLLLTLVRFVSAHPCEDRIMAAEYRIHEFLRFCFHASVAAVLVTALSLTCYAQVDSENAVIEILADEQLGPAAEHGLFAVENALAENGFQVVRSPDVSPAYRVVYGLSSEVGPAAELARTWDVELPTEPESLTVQIGELDDVPTLLLLGADDRGLMYAALDAADRIGWTAESESPFTQTHEGAESPYTPDRALSIYTMHQACFEERFFDEEYWDGYFDMMAANRFNRFVLIFGYENWGYFAPPYPYFFNVDGYPDIRVVGFTPERQAEYLAALRRMIEQAHARGLEFTVGIWDHIYRGGVQGPTGRAGEPTEGIVWGLDQDNLNEYTKAALAEFLHQLPEIDSIQFRMHGESGLRRDEMESFWTDVYGIMKDSNPEMRFDARAKNFPHELIDRAVEMDVPIRITTKYWMEQMGLPYHPTHVHPNNQMDRRHGYADLLRYPKQYDVHWRLWNAGTTRVLLWGDPDYVRRFSESTHLYDGQGFEINEMMGTKMQDHPHDLPPFDLLSPDRIYYDYEFERYWHFYQVWGRVSYNPDTPSDVWSHEFVERFGPDAGPIIEEALHEASKILPRIVAYNYPYNHFPTTRGWAARQRMGDLPDYAAALPSDTEQFQSMADAARRILNNEPSAKIMPWESSEWFRSRSWTLKELTERADELVGDHRNKEFDATIVDLKILAGLSGYHSARAHSGVYYALFQESHDIKDLSMAIYFEMIAIKSWEEIVQTAGDHYTDNLMMGRPQSGLAGHWRDELDLLKKGLDELIEEAETYDPRDENESLLLLHTPISEIQTSNNANFTLNPLLFATVYTDDYADLNVKLLYRIEGKPTFGDSTTSLAMSNEVHSFGMQHAKGLYQVSLPTDELFIGSVFSYKIEAETGDGEKASTEWFYPNVSEMNNYAQPPVFSHEPVLRAEPNQDLTLIAHVEDPDSNIAWIRIRHRPVSQFFDFETTEMQPVEGEDGVYRAVIPGEKLLSEWDFMYYIEVMDTSGNGCIYPDLEVETPYHIVRLHDVEEAEE
jgi:hypothetical protein